MPEPTNSALLKVLETQTDLLKKALKSSERTNEILWAILTPEQLKKIKDADVARLTDHKK